MDWREALKQFPVRYSEFGENVNEAGADAEYVTNRHMMWKASEADGKRNEKLASDVADGYGVTASSKSCRETFDKLTNKAAAGTLERLSLVEVRRSDHGRRTFDTAKLASESGETVWVDAQYLRILSLVVGFDELQTDGPERAIVVYRGGDVVGLVMPLREPRGPEKWEDREILVETDNE